MDNKFIDDFIDIIDMIEYLENKKEQTKNEAAKYELDRQIKHLEQQLRDMNDSQVPKQEEIQEIAAIQVENQESSKDKEISNDTDNKISDDADNSDEVPFTFDKNESDDNLNTANQQIDINDISIDDIDIATKPQYDEMGIFKNGFAKVRLNDKWGFVNESGNIVIDIMYDDVGDFFNGYAKIKLNDKVGYINRSGKIIIEPIFDEIGSFNEYDFIQVKLNGRYGFIDKNSNFYDEVGNFSNGLAKIKLNDKWGFVNANGDIAIELIYEEAGDFNYQGFAKVRLNGKWGFINKNGKFYDDKPVINF